MDGPVVDSTMQTANLEEVKLHHNAKKGIFVICIV